MQLQWLRKYWHQNASWNYIRPWRVKTVWHKVNVIISTVLYIHLLPVVKWLRLFWCRTLITGNEPVHLFIWIQQTMPLVIKVKSKWNHNQNHKKAQCSTPKCKLHKIIKEFTRNKLDKKSAIFCWTAWIIITSYIDGRGKKIAQNMIGWKECVMKKLPAKEIANMSWKCQM